ncbi:MAG: FAD-binding protein [Synechococcus sp. SP2 MAG]|nr:FAD-binding protein [Synechococcus sp. SP2 MAG]
MADDSHPAGWISTDAISLSNLIRQGIQPTPLLVCAGGTSSRCAADGLWTLDLRARHRQLIISEVGDEVEIGTGLTMAEVLKGLQAHGRSIPVGLSTVPGCGFVLTGGVGPLSRLQGLAMDHIVGLRGVWGNGNIFDLSAPANPAASTGTTFNKESHQQWKGLLGAAPFLAVVTAIRLRTQKLTPLMIWRAVCSVQQLEIAIEAAEQWTHSASLQWAWNERIELFIACSADDPAAMAAVQSLKTLLGHCAESSMTIVPGQHAQPPFGALATSTAAKGHNHSEVISRLGPAWGQRLPSLLKDLNQLIRERPHPGCQISAQQLGGMSSQVPVSRTSFIHRDAIWKPWINAVWNANDAEGRERSLDWLFHANSILTNYCPGVHLAQIHPHLSCHKAELCDAFQDWLPVLNQLKSHHDPYGLLPPL